MQVCRNECRIQECMQDTGMYAGMNAGMQEWMQDTGMNAGIQEWMQEWKKISEVTSSFHGIKIWLIYKTTLRHALTWCQVITRCSKRSVSKIYWCCLNISRHTVPICSCHVHSLKMAHFYKSQWICHSWTFNEHLKCLTSGTNTRPFT